jgi:hypothetical protein
VEFWLHAIDGRFPKMEEVLKPAEGTVYLTVHPTDATFVLDRLEKLPGKKDINSPVHLSAAKEVQVRAYDTEHQSGVALQLDHTAYKGEPLTVAMNRLFLKNALQFGCHRIGIDPAQDTPVMCNGENKTFIFLPLDKHPEPEYDTARMSVIPSPTHVVAPTKKVDAVQPKRRRRTTTAKRIPTKPTDKIALLETAEQIRQDLRNSLVQVNSLIREVKAQRHQDRLLRNTMDSLRKLSIV